MQSYQQQARPGISLNWMSPRGMALLGLKIFFLRLITLGIYHFWGKTEVRRKIWSAVHLQQQPLQYAGTGWELFLGFLIVLFLFVLPAYAALVGILLYFGDQSVEAAIAQVVFVVIVMFLVGVAQYRARNYRLSRTNWRGIRGHMAGSSWRYGLKVFGLSLLVPLTLGWIIPWMDTYLNRILTNETRFGSTPLRFSGNAGPLYKPFAIFWLGMIAIYGAIGGGMYYFFADKFINPHPGAAADPAFIFSIFGAVLLAAILVALFSAWYQSAKMNYFASCTTIDNARFHLTTTTWGLIWLFLSNLLIVLLTLGILTPIAQSRIAGYIVSRLGIDGQIDFAAIAQSQQALSKTGEGLAETFDVDAF